LTRASASRTGSRDAAMPNLLPIRRPSRRPGREGRRVVEPGQLVAVLMPDDKGRDVEPLRDRIKRGVIRRSAQGIQCLAYAVGRCQQLRGERAGHPLVVAAGRRQYERVLLRASQNPTKRSRLGKARPTASLEQTT